MKKDIENRTDIELLVDVFYAKIIRDPQLGLIFLEKAKVNWPTHLAAMYNFWENIILFTGNYEGNPMNLHQHLHHIAPLEESHFDQWNLLFVTTVNELFEGVNAKHAKERALNISAVIRERILDHQRLNRM